MAENTSNDIFIPALYKPSALLPIARHRESILYAVEKHQILILIGQTGSGKTTQIPQFLESAGWCVNGNVVAITQPRRVAATTVAARVAEERRCQLGQEVGYSIRFEDVTSEATRIKFLTDGLLLREALVDPLLSRYSVIMVDEAHERSLSSDILLGLLKKIRKRRPELRIIISSATLQAEAFLAFFNEEGLDPDFESSSGDKDSKKLENTQENNAGIISIEGRMFPVDIQYLAQPAEDYIEKAVQTVFDINAGEGEGDILVFLTGRDDIDTSIQMIADRLSSVPSSQPKLFPLPLYAGLSTEQQMYVFEETPSDHRKVILSTNIAEASITIPGIVYVIDSGFVKLRSYNPKTSISTLTSVPVSKAASTQRAGRAGRTKAGKCFRLYTSSAYDSLPATTTPEIQRSDLAPLILQLKALGIDNIARFPFLSPPPSALVIRALETLYSLGALDTYARLTKPLGLRMAELAIAPQMAKTLLSAAQPEFGCLSEVLSIAAMTSLEGAVFVQHDDSRKVAEHSRWKFAAEEGDQMTLLNVYQAFVSRGKKESSWCRMNGLNYKSMAKAVSVRNQLRRYLERFGIEVKESLGKGKEEMVGKGEKIRRCLTMGYFAHAARMAPDGSFKSVEGQVLWAHPSSLMFNRKADWVIFHEVVETGEKVYIRDITKIEKAWLTEYAPEYYKLSR